MRPPPEVAAELEIDVALARRLLARQRPPMIELSKEPGGKRDEALAITRLAEGWDNVMFRVGARWLLRLPRRAVAAELLRAELRWLPTLAPRLPLPVSAPAFVGQPEDFYPWPWALVPWLPGTPLGEVEEAALELRTIAGQLGAFLRVLHGLPAPADAPQNPFRGVPLATRGAAVEDRIARLVSLGEPLDVEVVRACWRRVVAQPSWSRAPLWCHGDLHPFNMLGRGGAIAAVIDWGDLHGGEPAPDLASAWMLLPRALHGEFRAAYGTIDDATWRRGQGWALYFGLTLLDAGLRAAGPAYVAVGRRTLARALADGA